jgi:hypothetical protein
LGQSLDPIIPEDLCARHWRGFDAAMASGALKLAGRPTLTRAQHKSGRKLYVELTFALVSNDGRPEGAVAMARDVTERVEQVRTRARSAPTPLSTIALLNPKPRIKARTFLPRIEREIRKALQTSPPLERAPSVHSDRA